MSKRVAVLTGGGDCPGLNAVIRAVTRRSHEHGYEVVGVRAGWRGLVDGLFMPLGPREISGLLPRGGTILGTSRTNPYKLDGGVEQVLSNFESEGLGALVAIGGEDTLGRCRAALRGAAVSGRRRSEDDRQRPQRDGLHVRLRHGRLDLHGGDRPAPHDRRVAQPGHGRRGDGPAHGLDRGHERDRRRSGRDPHPRAADHGRAGLQRDPAPPRAREDFSIVVVSEGYELTYDSGERRQVAQETAADEFGHVRLGGVGHELARDIEERTGLRDEGDRSRTRPARRELRRRGTASSRRATASRPRTSSTRSASA